MYSADMRDIDVIREFMKLLEASGFGQSGRSFSTFVRSLETSSSGKKDLLRKLYLASIGLAEFTPKGGKVHMLGYEYCSSEEGEAFKAGIWNCYKVFPEDDQKFSWEFDLAGIDLFPTPRKKQTQGDGWIQRTVSENPKVKFGTVWHMQWFHEHQEFIPESWKKVLADGGTIVFPGVRLSYRDNANAQYPFFRSSRTGGSIEYSHESEENLGEDMCRGRDFFAVMAKEA